MLKLKSSVILIIMIFSFIMPFSTMPFANASNVAHAQTQTMTVTDYNPDLTQWTTNVLNNKYIVTAFFPAVGQISTSNPFTIFFMNMTTSGVIQDIFYQYQSTASNLGGYVLASAIAYAGNNVYYLSWTNNRYIYLAEFNLTSKALTVLSIVNPAPNTIWAGMDSTIILFPFGSNYPVAAFQFYISTSENYPTTIFLMSNNKSILYQFNEYGNSGNYGFITGGTAYGGFPNANDFWVVLTEIIDNNPQVDIFYYNSVANTLSLEEQYVLTNVYCDYNNNIGFYMFNWYGQNVLNRFSATLVSSSSGNYYVNIPLAYGVLNSQYTEIFAYQFGLNTNYETQNVVAYIQGQGYVMANYMGATNNVYTIYVYNPSNSYYVTYNATSGVVRASGSLGNINYPTFYIGAEPLTYTPNTNKLTFTVGVYTPPNIITPPTTSTTTLSNSTGVSTPTPTSNSSATAINIYYINSAMNFMLPLVLILIPAIILMLYLGTKGFVGGLSLGMVIGVYAGFIPIWALVFLGIVMLFLIFWRNGERGDIT